MANELDAKSSVRIDFSADVSLIVEVLVIGFYTVSFGQLSYIIHEDSRIDQKKVHLKILVIFLVCSASY